MKAAIDPASRACEIERAILAADNANKLLGVTASEFDGVLNDMSLQDDAFAQAAKRMFHVVNLQLCPVRVNVKS